MERECSRAVSSGCERQVVFGTATVAGYAQNQLRSVNSKPFSRTLELHLLEQPDERQDGAAGLQARHRLQGARATARHGPA